MEYGEVEAATWAWKLLWKRDSTHIKYNILDAIMREGTNITGWLFTATDGSVKSKSNFRFNSANAIERCTKDDMKTISGHEYIQRSWRAVSIEELDFVFKNSPAVVLMGRINNPSFFVEQSYSLEPGEMLAKYVTNRLCPETVKGTGPLPVLGSTMGTVSLTASASSDLPTHRLRNKDKKLNKHGEDSIKELVHLLESKGRVIIRKMTAVYLVEVARNGVDASGSNMQLWLHHVSAVSAERKGGGDAGKEKGSVKGGWDSRSETSATIACSSVSGHQRGGTMRCAGDFCGFVDEEEALMQGNDEGSVAEEARNALRRHRRLTRQEEEEAGGPIKSPNGGDTEEEKANLHRQYGSGVLMGSQAFKVPQKHIVLVRNDMEILETLGDSDLLDPNLTDRVPWPTLVQHWWWRLGKSIMEGKAKRVIIPESSSHQIYGAIWNSEDKAAEDKDDGKLTPRSRLAKIAGNLNGDESIQKAGSGKLTAENLGFLEKQASFNGRSNKDSNLIKAFNSKETNSKMGDLSWYYSEANVCERCYHVYRDIERKRKLTVKEKAIRSYVNPYDTMYADLPTQAKEALRSVPLTERDRYLEARKQNFMRRQKSNIDRLAKAKVQDDDELNIQSDISTLGATDSINRRFISPAGAPKGVIPPTPWNLSDESVRSEYVEMGSAFIKSMKNKAKSISLQVREDQRLRDMELQMGIESSVDLSSNYNWKAMTGQVNGVQKNRLSKEELLGPNPLQKSMSADDVLRRRRQKRDKQEVKVVTKQFDSSRLMHKWQRDMEAERVQRRQEDEIWKNDVELNNRLHQLQSTGIVQGVVPVRKKKSSKPPVLLPTVPPTSILNQKSNSVQSSPSPSLDFAFRSAMTLSNAELGLTRKNSLHTIDEADDDDSPTSPHQYNNNSFGKSENKNNQMKSPVKQHQAAHVPIRPAVAFSKGPSNKSEATKFTSADSDIEDGDDDDDEGIGWSPFVVPLG